MYTYLFIIYLNKNNVYSVHVKKIGAIFNNSIWKMLSENVHSCCREISENETKMAAPRLPTLFGYMLYTKSPLRIYQMGNLSKQKKFETLLAFLFPCNVLFQQLMK